MYFGILKRHSLTSAAISCVALTFFHVARADVYDNEWENVSAKSKTNATPDQTIKNDDRLHDQEQQRDAQKLSQESGRGVRRFQEVLDELLAEFGYDVRMGQLKDLKNLSIRNVQVSEALPNTYKSYVELLVTERIRENARVRMINCIPCKTKTSQLVAGKLLITSPTTNVDRMRQAAEQLGVENFMDVVLVYHSTHMVLAMQIFNTSTQELTWSRAYNSETVRSRYQKLAIDYSQVESSRVGEEYTPDYKFLFGLGGGLIPNVTGSSDDNGMIVIMARGMERFDSRRHEFGLHTSIYLLKNTLLGGGSSSTEESNYNRLAASSDLEPWSTALSLYGMYGRHFVGSLESYDRIRHSLNFGLGFIASSAYLAPAIRAGWDMFFGRKFASNLGLVYIAPSEVTVGDESVTAQGGVGAEVALSINF